MQPNPAEHIALCQFVIKQMGLRGDVAEEAFSESLVALTTAAQRYDPGRGLPLAHWLARNIRWSIRSWMSKQRQEARIMATPGSLDLVTTAPNTDDRLRLQETVALANQILTPDEWRVVIGKAYGYKGTELAKILGCSEVQISRLRHRGVAKLKKAINAQT